MVQVQRRDLREQRVARVIVTSEFFALLVGLVEGLGRERLAQARALTFDALPAHLRLVAHESIDRHIKVRGNSR
jgi:hypothetical protein